MGFGKGEGQATPTNMINAPVLIVLSEIVVLAWTLWRKTATPIILFNGLAAATLLLLLVPNLGDAVRTIDEEFRRADFALIAFEAAALATSLLCLIYPKMRGLAAIEFAIQILLSLGLLGFSLTFKITRLI